MLATLSPRFLRGAAGVLGIGAAAFGLWPVLTPTRFARTFALPTAGGPAARLAIRSVGVRDLVLGLGLSLTALQGGPLAPWLLARTVADAGDAAAVGMTLAEGGGNRAVATLGGLAVGAAVAGAALWWAARPTTAHLLTTAARQSPCSTAP